MGRLDRALPALIALAAIAGCGGSQSASTLPSAGAAAQSQAVRKQPDVTLTVRPKSLFLSEPGAQGEIHVTYNGNGTLTAVSSRPHGMPVHPLHPGRAPKTYVITQHCFCAATITVHDNFGHHDSMSVQGT